MPPERMTRKDMALAVLGTLIVMGVIVLMYPRVVQSNEHAGEASYYDDGPGLYGAVHSYRWGDPRYDVRVCRLDDPERCVKVTVRDHMGNPTRAIDLSPEAFARLAPLSRGVVQVTVEVVGTSPRTTLPPTDTQETP